MFQSGKTGFALTDSYLIDTSLSATDGTPKGEIKLEYKHIQSVDMHLKDGTLDGVGIDITMADGRTYATKYAFTFEGYEMFVKFLRYIMLILN